MGLCRENSGGKGSFLFWGELYVNLLSWLSVSTPAYTQGYLLDFSSSLNPSYAKMKINDSNFSFLPVLMDETHKHNVG